MALPEITDNNFQAEVVESDTPTLVDFWAPWCGPCRMIAPALEEISGQLGDKVKIVKLNVDENPNTAAKYGIMSIPTLMIFRDGIQLFSQPGALPKSALDGLLKQVRELDMDEVRKQLDDESAGGHQHGADCNH